jgi:hypothetical protein
MRWVRRLEKLLKRNVLPNLVEHEQSREDEVVGAENAVNKEEHEAADTVASTEPATATVKVEGLVRASISFPMAWR